MTLEELSNSLKDIKILIESYPRKPQEQRWGIAIGHQDMRYYPTLKEALENEYPPTRKVS